MRKLGFCCSYEGAMEGRGLLSKDYPPMGSLTVEVFLSDIVFMKLAMFKANCSIPTLLLSILVLNILLEESPCSGLTVA